MIDERLYLCEVLQEVGPVVGKAVNMSCSELEAVSRMDSCLNECVFNERQS